MTIVMRVEKHHARPEFEALRTLVEWADGVGPMFRGELKRRCPVGNPPNDPRPGRLRDSIRYERHTGDGVRLEFKSSVPYAWYVVHGARPHHISARAARSLHWVGGDGGSRFAKMVHHPGNRANPFPAEAVADTSAAVINLLRDRMNGGL